MAGSPGSPKEFVRYVRKVRARTMALLPLASDDDLEWRCAPGTFSCGDIYRHLAGMERWMWAETVAGRPAAYPGHDERLASGRSALVRYVEELHAQSLAILDSLSMDAFLAPVVTPAGASLPAWKWLRAMVEHEAHHRGQLYLMLRMRGVVAPPLFGMTSEEVLAVSRRQHV
jgi:uncharacterized damage-inducible protein DinB